MSHAAGTRAQPAWWGGPHLPGAFPPGRGPGAAERAVADAAVAGAAGHGCRRAGPGAQDASAGRVRREGGGGGGAPPGARSGAPHRRLRRAAASPGDPAPGAALIRDVARTQGGCHPVSLLFHRTGSARGCPGST